MFLIHFVLQGRFADQSTSFFLLERIYYKHSAPAEATVQASLGSLLQLTSPWWTWFAVLFFEERTVGWPLGRLPLHRLLRFLCFLRHCWFLRLSVLNGSSCWFKLSTTRVHATACLCSPRSGVLSLCCACCVAHRDCGLWTTLFYVANS